MISNSSIIDNGLDTSDATATASDIISGKTAYVNGSKVIGNLAPKKSGTVTVVDYGAVTIPDLIGCSFAVLVRNSYIHNAVNFICSSQYYLYGNTVYTQGAQFYGSSGIIGASRVLNGTYYYAGW